MTSKAARTRGMPRRSEPVAARVGPIWGFGKPVPYGGNEQVIAVGYMEATTPRP